MPLGSRPPRGSRDRPRHSARVAAECSCLGKAPGRPAQAPAPPPTRRGHRAPRRGRSAAAFDLGTDRGRGRPAPGRGGQRRTPPARARPDRADAAVGWPDHSRLRRLVREVSHCADAARYLAMSRVKRSPTAVRREHDPAARASINESAGQRPSHRYRGSRSADLFPNG